MSASQPGAVSRPAGVSVVPAGPSSPILTVPQLVALVRSHGVDLTERQAYRWLAAGVIPSQRPNGDDKGAYILHRAEVLRWLEHGRESLGKESPDERPRAEPLPVLDIAIDITTAVLGVLQRYRRQMPR